MKKIYSTFILILLIVFSTALQGCRSFESSGNGEDASSEPEVVKIGASRAVELKESGQKDCSAVIAIGDDPDNNQIKGIIVFNIENLYGLDILKASVNISGAHTRSKPAFGEKVIIEAVDEIDFDRKGIYISDFEVGNYLDFVIVSEDLAKTVSSALSDGIKEYYLRFKLKNPTNGDSVEDLLIINTYDAYLETEFKD